ncbi:MAG: hypothetical protein J6K78_06950 [Tidjanibacter sp.]|nr:hypothetical protein [Tidjanibacter sp.]
MKKIYSILLMLSLLVGAATLYSCTEKPNAGNEIENPTPDPTPDPTPEPSLDAPEPLEHPNVPTPIAWGAYKAEPKVASDGVAIEVMSVENRNFVFACRPGLRAKSFRLDVYPLSVLYNALMEKMNTEGMPLTTPATPVEVEGWIREFMFAEGGNAAYTFDEEEPGYNNMVFDWANSEYMQIDVVPDCEYVIVAVACADTEGSASEQLEMTICYVRTPSGELVGNPQADIDVQTWTDRFVLTFLPNDDCHYFYYLWSMEADITPYLTHYGDQLYRDYMRNHMVGAEISRDDLDYHKLGMSGFPVGVDTTFMVTTIGTDVFSTPATSYQSKTFKLDKVPDGASPAEVSVTIDENHTGSNMAWFSADMTANTRVMFYRAYKASEAADIMAASPEQQAELVADLVYQGYGLVNHNYKFDMETNDLSQSQSCVATDCYMGLEADSEYVIVYTAVNPYQETMKLKFSEPFKTDALVTDKPAESKADVELSLVATSYTNVKFDFTYNFENTAIYYFRFVNPDSTKPEEGGLAEDATREEKVNFLLGLDEMMGAPLANVWQAERANSDTYTMVLDQGTTYKIAYVGEDWNGVLGDVKFVSVTTPTLIGGLNPEGKIEIVNEDGVERFKFSIVKEAASFKYLVGYEEPEVMIRYLGLDPYSEFVKGWTWYVTDCGLTAKGMLSTTIDIHKHSLVGNEKRCVALMMAIGTDALGGEVYGELEHLIYENGVARTLESYYPNMATPAQQTVNKASAQLDAVYAISHQRADVERPSRVVRPIEAGDVESLQRVVRVSMKSKHPKSLK